MKHVKYVWVSPASSTEDGMGWLRLVGSLKLYVSSAEYRLFCRALLQKRPVILRSLLVEATPYVCVCVCILWMSLVTHKNESRYTYKWVTSHMWMSHVKYVWVSPASSKYDGICVCVCMCVLVTYAWASSNIWMRLVTHLHESRHTYECVTSHIWMSHIKYVWVSLASSTEDGMCVCVCVCVCVTYKCASAHIWMSFGTNKNEPHKNEQRYTNTYTSSVRDLCWPMTTWHIRTCHIPHMNESDHTYEWISAHYECGTQEWATSHKYAYRQCKTARPNGWFIFPYW